MCSRHNNNASNIACFFYENHVELQVSRQYVKSAIEKIEETSSIQNRKRERIRPIRNEGVRDIIMGNFLWLTDHQLQKFRMILEI